MFWLVDGTISEIMPRSADELDNSEDRTSRRRAAASRVTARRGVARSTNRRVTRARAITKPEVVEEERSVPPVSEDAGSVSRKAPTGISDEKALERRRQTRLIIIGVLVAIGVGASAAVGFTDEGEIDVLKTIEARNERIRNNQATEQDVLTTTIEVPVQNTNERKVDGGLKGRGTGGAAPEPPEEVASTTASSTDVTASSTDATASSTDAVIEEEEEVAADESDAPSADTAAARPEDAPLEEEIAQ